MDEHGCLVYEWNGTEYIGECSCSLQVRGRTEDRLKRAYYDHAGYINPHLKKEVERQRETVG